MAFGIKLHIWGEYACFTRPEMKVERVSYDVITPSAARGILEAIYWKPEITWIIDKIHVLKPIRFESIRRNELGSKISARNVATAIKSKTTDGLHILIEEDRQQRAATVLRDVAYVIEAHFEINRSTSTETTSGDSCAKHISMFNRRALSGQCFHQPCMGTREFPASFALIDGSDPLPVSEMQEADQNRDLGWMLHDIDFANGNTPYFFRAQLQEAVISIPVRANNEVKA
jgi:CRISPR-associated protein Cas5d